MCWSKHSSSDDESNSGLSTTTRKPMANGTQCPSHGKPCEPEKLNKFCSNRGNCCILKQDDRSFDFCVCENRYYGTNCQNRYREPSIIDWERAQYIAVFSAILGVVIITLFVVVVALQVKYYRRRRKKFVDDHEMGKVPTRDASESVKEGKKRLTIQPGYSWRQSVRGHSKRLIGASCKSVPDDLFAVGLKLAFLGGGERGKRGDLFQITGAQSKNGEGNEQKRGVFEGSGACLDASLSTGQKQETGDSEQSNKQETEVSGDNTVANSKGQVDTVEATTPENRPTAV